MEWLEWIPIYGDIVFREPLRFLYVTPVVILGLSFVWWWGRRGKERVLADPWIRMHISSSRLPSRLQFWCSRSVQLLVVLLVVCLIAEPERKHTEREPVYGATRIAFVLDVSKSMKFARDVEPNRLEVAKDVIRDFASMLWQDPELKGNYELALLPFSGEAIALFVSFTTSRSGFIAHLDSVSENTISQRGTDIFAAIRGYGELLTHYPADEDDSGVDIAVLISDGGAESGIETPFNSIQRYLQQLPENTRVYTVGIGSKEMNPSCAARERRRNPSIAQGLLEEKCARPVPVTLYKEQEDGSLTYLLETPRDGNSPILESKLDEGILKFVAENGRGEYIFFKNREILFSSLRDIVLKNRVQDRVVERSFFKPAVREFAIPAFVLAYFAFGFGRWASSHARSGVRRLLHRP